MFKGFKPTCRAIILPIKPFVHRRSRCRRRRGLLKVPNVLRQRVVSYNIYSLQTCYVL